MATILPGKRWLGKYFLMTSVQDLSQRVVSYFQKMSLNNVLLCRIFQLSRVLIVLRYQLNWLNRTYPTSLFSLTAGFDVCNETHRILEKPLARMASPHWLFPPTSIVSPTESILARSWNTMKKGPFVMKNIAILWWLIHAWWKQKWPVPDSWFYFFVVAFNRCLTLKQMYTDTIIAFHYCGVLNVWVGSQSFMGDLFICFFLVFWGGEERRNNPGKIRFKEVWLESSTQTVVHTATVQWHNLQLTESSPERCLRGIHVFFSFFSFF